MKAHTHEDDAYQNAYIGDIPSLFTALRHWLHKTLVDPVSALTLMLVASTIALWWSTRRLWVGADKQMALAHRPWIPVMLSDHSGLEITRDGAALTLSFELRNTGNHPAFTVFPFAEIVPTWPQSQFDKRLAAIFASGPVLKNVGVTIFPGDAHVAFPRTVSLDNADLAAGKSGTRVPMMLVGAIFYRGIGDALHHSGFCFEILRRGDDDLLLDVDISRGSVAKAELLLRPSMYRQVSTT